MHFNPFSPKLAKTIPLCYCTLSNARRFYSLRESLWVVGKGNNWAYLPHLSSLTLSLLYSQEVCCSLDGVVLMLRTLAFIITKQDELKEHLVTITEGYFFIYYC